MAESTLPITATQTAESIYQMAVTIDSEVRAIWAACVQSTYDDKATADCKYNCGHRGTSCAQFFCVTCKEGGLCRSAFLGEGRPHSKHDSLQVFKSSGAYFVTQSDVQRYFIRRSNMIAELTTSRGVSHKLKKANPTKKPPGMFCHGCNEFVPNARTASLMEKNENTAKVCSMECLLTYTPHPSSYRDYSRNRRKQLHPQRSPSR